MENKRNILASLALVSTFLVLTPTYGETSVPNSVKTFYNGMTKLSQISDENIAYDISKSMNECFYGWDVSVSGILLPNDFRLFDYDKKNDISHNDEKLNSATYVNRLKEYIYKDRVLKVDFRILKSEAIGDQPDFHKGKLSVATSLVSTYVEKTYILNGTRRIFNDTVCTDYTSGKISEIKNGYGKTIININTLRNKAALAYRLKKFYEAFKCYEQIISIAPNDADALYRIGLMVYFQYDDCKIRKKERKNKAKTYLTKAQWYDRHSGIGEKAKNVLHWINYSNV